MFCFAGLDLERVADYTLCSKCVLGAMRSKVQLQIYNTVKGSKGHYALSRLYLIVRLIIG